MRKQTVSAILTGIIVCLVIAIVILIVKIGMRGPKVEEADMSLASAETTTEEETDVTAEAEVEIEPELIAVPDTSTSVNVRSGPGVEFDRVGSAYSTSEYVVIEVLGSGWTKIDYDGEEGYISNEFLSYKYRQDKGDGTYIYYDAPEYNGTESDEAVTDDVSESSTDETMDEISEEENEEDVTEEPDTMIQ